MSRQPYQDSIPQVPHALPRPMVNICFAIMGGILYAVWFPVSFSFFLLALLGLAVCSLTIRNNDSGKSMHAILLGIAFLTGALRMEYSIENQQNILYEIKEWKNTGKQAVSGMVEEIAEYQDGSSKLLLNSVEIEKWRRQRLFPGKIELWGNTAAFKAVSIGNRIQVTEELFAVEGPKVPLPFNTQDYRLSNGIYAQAYTGLQDKIVIVQPATHFSIRDLAYESFNRMQKYLLPGPEKPEINGLLSSMCLGLRSATPAKLQQDLIKSGLAHLTSISGIHVSIFLLSLAYFLKMMGFTRRQCAITAFAAGIFYMLLVGYSVPALRSVLMAYVFFGACFAERRFSTLNSLGLSAVIILLLSPRELFLPSFQLSYTAVLLLFLFQPLDTWLRQTIIIKPLSWLARSVAVSAILSIGMIPFTSYFFHLWSWSAIFGNLLAIPISTVLLPVTYIWLLFVYLPIPFVPEMLGSIVQVLSAALLYVIHFFAGYSFFYCSFSFPGFFPSALGFFAFLLLCSPTAEIFPAARFPVRAIHLSLFLVVLALWSFPLFSPAANFKVHFPSLGQGDCTLIQTPEGETILVDAGPLQMKKDPSRNPLLMDYLLSLGITKIDVLVLSHPQSDHTGCMKEIALKFPVTHFMEGVSDPTNQAYRELKETLQSQKTQIHPLCAGNHLQINRLEAWVLNPTDAMISSTVDMNEKSIVLYVAYGNVSLLLAGDIGPDAEKRLLRQYQNLHADILKIPHHGSRESNPLPFVQAVKPDVAIIEVGKNAYGHPHNETLKNYAIAGTQILRTDTDGTILFTWNGSYRRFYASQQNTLFTIIK